MGGGSGCGGGGLQMPQSVNTGKIEHFFWFFQPVSVSQPLWKCLLLRIFAAFVQNCSGHEGLQVSKHYVEVRVLLLVPSLVACQVPCLVACPVVLVLGVAVLVWVVVALFCV